jgi:hypothetical protein
MKDRQPSDRDVDRVRRALQAAAPPDADPVRRADRVARRGRQVRARQGMASAVAIGLAAAVVIIGPHFIDSSPVTNSADDHVSTTTQTWPDPGGAEASPYANPCPAAPVAVPDRPAEPVLLQPDVVTVRLCTAQGSGVSSPWQPPQDALVHEVDGFTAEVAQLPKAPADPCPAARVAPEPFALQFTDFAGHTETLTSMLTSCGTVTVNFHRVAADRLLSVYRHSLMHQRDTVPAKPPTSTLTCGAGSPPIQPSWLAQVTAQTRFIAAASCPDSSQGGSQVSASAIARLNQEWAASARRIRPFSTPPSVHGCPAPADGALASYVMTSAGDVVPTRAGEQCGSYRIGHYQFYPSDQLLQALFPR